MSLPAEVRDEIRRRANYACEFCSVSETDAGGELTIDHYRPTSKGGKDDIENLVYCCPRCNLYKRDYWPETPSALPLWNPRLQPKGEQYIELEDGFLYPLTEAADFTINRLRLNRRPLVTLRLMRQTRNNERRLLQRYQELTHLLEQLNGQLSALVLEQQALLAEQNELLRQFLSRGR